MQSFHQSVLAFLVFVLPITLLGCQKTAETTPPTAAVQGGAPGGDKAKSQAALAADPGEAAEPKPDPNLTHPAFAIDTTAGKITVRLDAEKAPLTVDNFRNYVARGHYDQTIFHQIVKTPVQIVLGGVYTSDLKEKTPLTPIRNEADNGLKNRRGTIAMLRRANDEDSATCQFFFNISDNEILNYKAPAANASGEGTDQASIDRARAASYGYCVFGEVTEGMDVLDQIAKTPVHDSGNHKDMPVEPVTIKSVRQVK